MGIRKKQVFCNFSIKNMFISALVFRKSFTTKSTVTGMSVFKNLLEKCVVRRFTNFHFCKNSKSFSTTNQRQISFTR